MNICIASLVYIYGFGDLYADLPTYVAVVDGWEKRYICDFVPF